MCPVPAKAAVGGYVVGVGQFFRGGTAVNQPAAIPGTQILPVADGVADLQRYADSVGSEFFRALHKRLHQLSMGFQGGKAIP